MSLKRKVFIMAYARANVGDDLFIIELLKRYKDIDFYIAIKEKRYSEAFRNYKNLTIIYNSEENFDNLIPEAYDAYIYVGGSIFIENGKVYNLDLGCNQFIKKCYEKNIPFFYVSCNFGPYKTQEYFNLAKDTFKYCTDICFRDIYSYELFKEIPTVRYAPDLIFNLESSICNVDKETIGISVIDMSIRSNLAKYEENHIKCMVHNIIKYIKDKKDVYLFSFCKEENDESAIEKIEKEIPQLYKERLHKVYYKGNIEEYIRTYKSMEYMITCRFHASILSATLGQKMYVLSYSKKIDDVLEDLSLVDKYTRIEDLKEKTSIEISDFKSVNKEKIMHIKQYDKYQLAKFDEWYNKI